MGRLVRFTPDKMGEEGRSLLLLLSSLRCSADDNFERLADGAISSGVNSSSELRDMCRSLEIGGVFNRLRLNRDSFLKLSSVQTTI